MSEKIFLQTQSLNLAATLLAMGYDVVAINDLNPKQAYFLFAQDQVVEDIMKTKFWSGELRVEPQALFYARSELLSRLKQSADTKGGAVNGEQN